eukprot:5520537-Prymnesium_polylepis.1
MIRAARSAAEEGIEAVLAEDKAAGRGGGSTGPTDEETGREGRRVGAACAAGIGSRGSEDRADVRRGEKRSGPARTGALSRSLSVTGDVNATP